MATFNSEKYLSEQLNSLFKQSYQNWTLYIRDDGSIDNTIPIIRKYMDNHNNIRLMDDPIKNRGARNSFLWMLENVDSEYYMFCDHDDIWLHQKIELTLNSMLNFSRLHPSRPLLICTDLIVVDEDLNILANSLWNFAKVYPKYITNYKYLSVCNYVTGCTTIINKKAKEIIFPLSKNTLMHDFLIALKVSKYGYIKYLNTPTILYRQHSNNEIGAKKYPSLLSLFTQKTINILTFLQQNKKLFLQVNSVVRISFFEYFCHKIIYQFKRILSNGKGCYN